MSDIVERLRADLASGLSANLGDTKEAADEIENLRAALDKAADALHDAGCYDAWAAARATLGKKSMSDYHEGLEEGIKIGMAEAAAKIEKMREAIEMARQCIDADDVIGAHQILTKALGEDE